MIFTTSLISAAEEFQWPNFFVLGRLLFDMRQLPPVGLGTMGLDGPTGVTAIKTAIELGYRHLDTAQIYDNEEVVGAAVEQSPTARNELTIATKVWADSLTPEQVFNTTTESAAKLGVETIDLLYVHRPIDTYDPETTLPAFEQLVDEGLVSNVGLSNFTIEEIETAHNVLSSPISAHQTELHPLFYQPALIDHAREHNYTVVGYSPLAGGAVFELPTLVEIAEKHESTPAAVSIAWLTEKENVVVIPKATSKTHLRANIEAKSLELDPEDVAAIESIEAERELFAE